MLKIQIYSGTKFTDTESLGQIGSIVLHVMETYLNKGYHLLTDNWYNSVSLAEYMSKRNTYITGTLRGDRKWNPSQVVGKKLLNGEMVFMSLGDVSVTKWKDKRMFVSSAMLMCQQWWIQSTGMANPKGNQTLFISTTAICLEFIDQIKCWRITLHCDKL